MDSSSTQNALAIHFKSLHKPGDPLIVTNIWDAISATAIASLPSTKALATASYAIAAAAALPDNDLDLPTNLRAVAAIAKVAAQHNLPLTVDMQDGFGAQLQDGVREIIKVGAVGMNLEDYARELDGLYGVDEACERIRRVMSVAREMGVPDFVLNARTDAFFTATAEEPAGIDAVVARGKAYLDAGASNVFVWGGPSRGGWERADVQRATAEFGGMLNVLLVRIGTGGLSVEELRGVGVCRISVGPQLMMKTVEMMKREAAGILEGVGVED